MKVQDEMRLGWRGVVRSVWEKVWGRERENMKGSGFIYAVAFSIGGVMGT